AAGSWSRERRIAARIEATAKGLDIRYVVTSLKGTAKHLYETVYCARGQAENFIKWHKAQLASDRTSCRDPTANQFRLILHTAAYWLMLAMRGAVPARAQLSYAELESPANGSRRMQSGRSERQPKRCDATVLFQ